MVCFRRAFPRWWIAGLTLAAGLLHSAPVPTAPAPAALVFLLSDQHSAYALTAQVVAKIDHIRAQHPHVPAAVLINGDIFEAGNPIARRSGGQLDYAMLTALAARLPTVVNVGNHDCEFADPAPSIARLHATGATVLSNLSHADTGQPFAPATTTLTLGPVTLSLIGLATPDLSTYPAAVRPSLTAPTPVDEWQTHGAAPFPPATVPVVLSHAGVAADRLLLPALPPGTLLVGGHNHLCFVHREPVSDVVYVHSGCWNTILSVARLDLNPAGSPHWTVTQESIHLDDPADPALATAIAEVSTRYLTAEDRTVLGYTAAALNAPDAARWAVAAAQAATHADAAFIGNTTFGAGLPAGSVTQIDFDACIRFDGTLCTAEVSGRQLAALLAIANPGPDTPFASRHGEFLYGVGPDPTTLDPDHIYLIATNDWCARNTSRYFGPTAITWTALPDLNLKAAAITHFDPTTPNPRPNPPTP